MLGPARIRDVPAEIEELPRIDFVLSMLQQYTLARDAIRPAATLVLTVLRCCTVSHNHYDHLDSNSIKRIAQVSPDATWYVPSGLRVCHQRVRTSHLVSGHHRLIDRERECVCARLIVLVQQPLLESHSVRNVVELSWWEEHKQDSTDIRVVCLPSQHWSRRMSCTQCTASGESGLTCHLIDIDLRRSIRQ
jgi:hypothetical protein